jgi:hypothetical protein
VHWYCLDSVAETTAKQERQKPAEKHYATYFD